MSGGARGADTMAHQKTLDHGGKTVAVLGSGLMRPYPPENDNLFSAIIEQGGALVSIFPLLMEPLAEHFPARNRVIAGLSRGCLVIQAAAKSGTKITAEYCLNQGREVFAVPGPINDPLSAGCHDLIGQGAKLVSNAADILAEFGYELPATVPIEPQEKPGKKAQKPYVPAFQTSIILEDPLEAAIVAACIKPCSVDELLEATGISLITFEQKAL